MLSYCFMGKNTITLDNFADFHGEVNGVEIQSNLPFESYVPTTEIDVNIGRIARAARIGHLGSIAFRRYSEQTSITPGIDSVSDNGSATASFSVTASKAPRIDPSLNPRRGSVLYTKGDGTVKINFGHDDLNDISLREAKPWAHYLDKTLSESLRACGNRQLMKNKPFRTLISSIYLLSPVLDFAGHKFGSIPSGYARSLMWYTGSTAIFAGTQGEYTSLTPGLPIDRLGLTQAYTRTRKFVKAR
jgi:hypothetical protein